MDEDEKAIVALPAPPSPKGAKRATLALVLSVLALAVSAFGVAMPFLEKEGVLPPFLAAAIRPTAQTIPVVDQARDEAISRDMERLAARVDVLASRPLPPTVITAPSEEFRDRLGETQKNLEDLKDELHATLGRNMRVLAGLELLRTIRGKLRDGSDFSRALRKLGEDPPIFPDPPAAAKLAGSVRGGPGLSDAALISGLQALGPRFVAREKMAHAEGFFQKLWLRMKGLVTIRPRDGMARPESPAGKSLEALQARLDAGDFSAALKTAEELQESAPPGFTEWRNSLSARAEGEQALDRLEDALLVRLRGGVIAPPSPPVMEVLPPEDEGTPFSGSEAAP